MENNEQWKDLGDCDKCRRKDYCGTQCKANKRFRYSQAYNFVMKQLELKDKMEKAGEQQKQ